MTQALPDEVERRIAAMVDEILEGTSISRGAAESMVRRVFEQAVLVERERCIAACRKRASLWRDTLGAKSTLAPARDEARARANEALYLADLLAAPAMGAVMTDGESIN